MKRDHKYWNRLLTAYISGDISDEDRFEIEKKALDDPFLFEALEAYANASLKSNRQTIASVDKYVKNKTNYSTRSFTFKPYLIAASLLIFAAASFFLYQGILPTNDKSVLVENSTPESKMESAEVQSALNQEELLFDEQQLQKPAAAYRKENAAQFSEKQHEALERTIKLNEDEYAPYVVENDLFGQHVIRPDKTEIGSHRKKENDNKDLFYHIRWFDKDSNNIESNDNLVQLEDKLNDLFKAYDYKNEKEIKIIIFKTIIELSEENKISKFRILKSNTGGLDNLIEEFFYSINEWKVLDENKDRNGEFKIHIVWD